MESGRVIWSGFPVVIWWNLAGSSGQDFLWSSGGIWPGHLVRISCQVMSGHLVRISCQVMSGHLVRISCQVMSGHLPRFPAMTGSHRRRAEFPEACLQISRDREAGQIWRLFFPIRSHWNRKKFS